MAEDHQLRVSENNLSDPTVFQVEDAGLAHVFELGAGLANDRLFEAAVAARVPAEDGVRPAADVALLAQRLLQHANIGVLMKKKKKKRALQGEVLTMIRFR